MTRFNGDGPQPAKRNVAMQHAGTSRRNVRGEDYRSDGSPWRWPECGFRRLPFSKSEIGSQGATPVSGYICAARGYASDHMLRLSRPLVADVSETVDELIAVNKS